MRQYILSNEGSTGQQAKNSGLLEKVSNQRDGLAEKVGVERFAELRSDITARRELVTVIMSGILIPVVSRCLTG